MWGNGFVDFMDVDRAWMIFTRMKEGPFALMDKVGAEIGQLFAGSHSADAPQAASAGALLLRFRPRLKTWR